MGILNVSNANNNNNNNNNNDNNDNNNNNVKVTQSVLENEFDNEYGTMSMGMGPGRSFPDFEDYEQDEEGDRNLRSRPYAKLKTNIVSLYTRRMSQYLPCWLSWKVPHLGDKRIRRKTLLQDDE